MHVVWVHNTNQPNQPTRQPNHIVIWAQPGPSQVVRIMSYDDGNDGVFDYLFSGKARATMKETYPPDLDQAKQWYKLMFFGNCQHANDHNRLAAIAVADRVGRFYFLDREYKNDPHVVRIALLKSLYCGKCREDILRSASQAALDANIDLVKQL